jgi:RNA polymerase sigma-70 factor (ECF subfamily)
MMTVVERPRENLSIADAALLANAQRGDDASLEALIRRYEPRVYALARAIVKQPAWAEDVTQDTLLRMVQKLPEYDAPPERFDTWLLCIARNAAISVMRKRQVRGDFDGLQPGRHPDNAFDNRLPSPSDVAIALEDSARLAKALDRLPVAAREIVILRFYHDLAPVDIGRVVGDSAANVRVRLFRAIAELRTWLAEKDATS